MVELGGRVIVLIEYTMYRPFICTSGTQDTVLQTSADAVNTIHRKALNFVFFGQKCNVMMAIEEHMLFVTAADSWKLQASAAT